jgi:alanyl-tRNA synthetase
MMIDDAGFEKLMEVQRQKARVSWKGSGEEKVETVYKDLKGKGIVTKFVGYEKVSADAKVLAVIPPPPKGEGWGEGVIQFVTDTTPFYGESGGQAGDAGMAVAEGLEVEITGATKPLPGLIVHHGRVQKGMLKVGQRLTLAIDVDRRADIMRNHTATHLLHKALREELGEHVKQAGSSVGPDRLRFDFSHFQALTPAEIKEIESSVNDAIRKNFKVSVAEMDYEEAVRTGALAFFGEKYGDKVRVVSAGGYSSELCGGTHVGFTGDIGMMKIISESSVASGVRRIEAVTGRGVEDYLDRLEDMMKGLARELKVGIDDVPDRVKKITENLKRLEKQTAGGQIAAGAKSAEVQITELGGVNAIVLRVEAQNVAALRATADQYKQKISSGVVVLASAIDGKASFIVCVTKDLVGRFNAGDIIKKMSASVGGTGGGRPDMAQGGAPSADRIDTALDTARTLIKT